MKKNKTILLVEDDVITAMVEIHTLEEGGYTVLHAIDGLEAIKIVNSDYSRIDLILMDIDLGVGMDGTEAAKKILKHHDFPIVFLSSHTEKNIVEKTESITSYGYVLKHSNDFVLLASIKMAFKLHQAHRKLEEKDRAVHESEQRYLDVFNNVVEGVFRTSAKGRFIYINPSGARMFGYESISEMIEEVTDISSQLYAHPRDREHILGILSRQQRIENLEVEYIHRSGAHFWVSLKAVAGYDESGDIEHLTCSIVDITERKRIKERLEESEERFRALAQASFEAVLIIEDGVIIDANQNSSIMFGYSPEELIGMTIDKLTAPEIDGYIRSRGDNGIEYPIEAITIRKDGSRFLAELQLKTFPCRGHSAIITAARDITGQVKNLVRNQIEEVELYRDHNNYGRHM